MGAVGKLAALGAVAVLLTTAGCGGSDDEVSSSTVGALSSYDYVKGPTREFLVPGGDNIVQLFGHEASPASREEASQAIHAWMRARAVQDWRKACDLFSRKHSKALVLDANGVSEGKVKTCPQALAYFGHRASGDYVNNLAGPIDSLRVEKKLGWAQYHGRDGKDWIVPVERDNGRWMVATATPLDRNK